MDNTESHEAEGATSDKKPVVAWKPENPDVVDLRGAGPGVLSTVLSVVRLLRTHMGLDPDGFTILED